MITISERREHESAKSFVLRVLIDNIINTRLEPGEKLNEPELCEQLGVSRTPFREAPPSGKHSWSWRSGGSLRSGPRSAPMFLSSMQSWWKKCAICALCWKQRSPAWRAKS